MNLLTCAFASLLCMSLHSAETVYFLAGRPGSSRPESYVIPMTNHQHIAEARAQIGGSTVKRMPACKIAVGRDGVHRDYFANGLPAWSWHVTQFGGFTDATTLGYRPSFVELDPQSYVVEFGGAFIYGEIVREMAFSEIFYASAALIDGQITLRWPNLGEGYKYTVQTADPHSPPDWKPVPDAVWPRTTNSWTISSSAPESRIYRIIAEPQN